MVMTLQPLKFAVARLAALRYPPMPLPHRRELWPVTRKAFLLRISIVGLGAILGTIEGVIVGACAGSLHDKTGIYIHAGVLFGAFYGGLTGWAYKRLKCAFSAPKVVSVMLWPLSGLMIACSVIEVFPVTEQAPYWDVPFFIIILPPLLVLAACAIEFPISENRHEFFGANIPLPDDTHRPMTDREWDDESLTATCVAMIACVAMITGEPAGQLAERVPILSRRSWPAQLTAFLESETGEGWEEIPLVFFRRRLDEFVFPDEPVILLIRPPWKFRQARLVVGRGYTVLDPAWVHPFYLDEYWAKGWRVLMAFRMAERPIAVRT